MFNPFLANVTTRDLGASRYGPIPLFAIRLKAGDHISLPHDRCMAANNVYPSDTEREPEFVRTFQNNLSAPRRPQLDEVSLVALSLVMAD